MINRKGDAIELFKQCEADCVLIHQVNAKGVMGSGIAKQIREEFPEHYDDYISAHRNSRLSLGTWVETYTSHIPNKRVLGICSQDSYGYEGKRYTNYAALSNIIFKYFIDKMHMNVFIPKYIGCGLGGGDWNIVEALLKDLQELDPFNEFIIVELDK